MSKYFRQMFVLLENLQVQAEFQTLFRSDYQPAAWLMAGLADDQELLRLRPGISTGTVTESAKRVEGQYFNYSLSLRLPRPLDPSQDIYWLLSYTVDCLHRRTLSGGGFCPAPRDELAVVRRAYKELKMKHNTAGVASAAAAATRAASSIPVEGLSGMSVDEPMQPNNLKAHRASRAHDATAHTTSPRISKKHNQGRATGAAAATTARMHQSSTSSLQNTHDNGNSSPAALNLHERLAAAAHEAAVELKLYALQSKVKQGKLHQKQEQGQQQQEQTQEIPGGTGASLGGALSELLGQTNEASEGTAGDEDSVDYDSDSVGTPDQFDTTGLSEPGRYGRQQQQQKTGGRTTKPRQPVPSVVWTCRPRAALSDGRGLQFSVANDKEDEQHAAFKDGGPLQTRLPREEAIKYAAKLKAEKLKQKEEEDRSVYA